MEVMTMVENNYKRLKLYILYGSQTGTAQDVAENIAMQSRGTNFRAIAMELDTYPIQNMVNEDLIVFVCSTTGQGEPPDNMKKFWRFIMRKNLPGNSLENLKYGVLGLGDSSYTKFNFVAKKLNRRIQQLGGQELVSMGLADDQHEWGPDATVDPWVTGLWKKLLQVYPTPPNCLNPLGGNLPPARFTMEKNVERNPPQEKEVSDHEKYDRDHPFFAKIKRNQRVTTLDHFQETILVSLDVSGAHKQLSYLPGDVVMIKPSNTKENVQRFLDCFPETNADESVFIKSNDEDCTMPSVIKNPTTLRQLSTTYFDFMSVPRRSFFQIFQHFADDEMEREKLVELGTPEGTDERYDYVNRPRRNILEVLQDFHKTTKNLPVSRLFDLIPLIQPRAFSIASSPSFHTDEIQVLVAVVKYKTMLHIPRCGLCSTWLSKLPVGSKLPIWVKTGGIRFPNVAHPPAGNAVPLVMIGPGTGVAPFRSAICERKFHGARENVLFFGCRSKDADFYFEEEWSELVRTGFLHLHTAFSRDQENKIYVQDKIREQDAYLWDLVSNHNANIYVAGNSKNMPDGVKEAFLNIFQSFGEMTEKEAKDYYESLQRNKRYQQETWS